MLQFWFHPGWYCAHLSPDYEIHTLSFDVFISGFDHLSIRILNCSNIDESYVLASHVLPVITSAPVGASFISNPIEACSGHLIFSFQWRWSSLYSYLEPFGYWQELCSCFTCISCHCISACRRIIYFQFDRSMFLLHRPSPTLYLFISPDQFRVRHMLGRVPAGLLPKAWYGLVTPFCMRATAGWSSITV